jgi:uncharacterized phage protein gp47/JayE
MSARIDETGITIQSFDEIYQELVDAYKAIYGQDINIDQESPDGQRIGIEALARNDMQALAAAIHNGFDPDLAQGIALFKIAKICGISPRAATRSQWDLVVSSDRPLILNAGYTVEDDLGQRWALNSDVNLFVGDTVVTFRADEFGEKFGSIGAEITAVTVVRGVTGIRADVPAVAGKEEETNEEFRIRRNKSLENPAFSTIGSLFAKLANLPGVTALATHENCTDAYDQIRDIPPRTVWAIVENGAVADIVRTMVKQRTAGSNTKGDYSGTFVESLLNPDGTIFYITHKMNFDRPTYVDIYVNLTVTRKIYNEPVDLDLIKLQIASRKFGIGEPLQAGQLYCLAYGAGTDYVVTDMAISTDNINFTEALITPKLDEKFIIDAANILINEVF